MVTGGFTHPLWSRIIKNSDVSIGSLAVLSTGLLTPLVCLLASLTRSTVLTCSLACSLTLELVGKWMIGWLFLLCFFFFSGPLCGGGVGIHSPLASSNFTREWLDEREIYANEGDGVKLITFHSHGGKTEGKLKNARALSKSFLSLPFFRARVRRQVHKACSSRRAFVRFS